MKKLILMLTASVIASFVFAQKTSGINIPEYVKNSLKKQFPSAKDVKWEKEDSNYEAEFMVCCTESSALFSPQGNLLETEAEIALSELPGGVIEYARSKYPDQPIKEAEKITDAKGIITFEIGLKNLDLIFDNNGVCIKDLKH